MTSDLLTIATEMDEPIRPAEFWLMRVSPCHGWRL